MGFWEQVYKNAWIEISCQYERVGLVYIKLYKMKSYMSVVGAKTT